MLVSQRQTSKATMTTVQC